MGLLYKLAYLAQTKTDIREALQEKGSDVTEADTFRSYADFVSELSGGDVSAGAPSVMLSTGTDAGIAGLSEKIYPI